MGYYIRVLSRQSQPVAGTLLQQALESEGLRARVVMDGEDDDAWEALGLAHPDGTYFAAIERSVVAPGSLAEGEIQEFIDEVPSYGPSNAAEWLVRYLPSVQAIYAIQILGPADQGDGWAAIDLIKAVLWNAGGGILQADNEGFSNEDGYHILWQFSDDVEGPWHMAVLNEDGSWTRFKMDLGRKAHRSSFLEGRVPSGVTVL